MLLLPSLCILLDLLATLAALQQRRDDTEQQKKYEKKGLPVQAIGASSGSSPDSEIDVRMSVSDWMLRIR